MSYRARLSHDADKDFARLDRRTQERIRDRLKELEADPYNPRISKLLKGASRICSSRVGGWRILYYLKEAAGILWVIAIRPRGEAYRALQ